MVSDLWAADVVVLGLIVPTAGVHFSIGPPYRGARYAADQTGGDTLETGEAAGGLQEMIRRLRSRYSLYYSMPEGKPGEWRRIRVQLTKQAAKRYLGATVRARTGYVSTAHD